MILQDWTTWADPARGATAVASGLAGAFATLGRRVQDLLGQVPSEIPDLGLPEVRAEAAKLDEIVTNAQEKKPIRHAVKDNPLPTEEDLNAYFKEVADQSTMGNLWLPGSLRNPECIRQRNDVFELNPDAGPIQFPVARENEWGEKPFTDFFEYNVEQLRWTVKPRFNPAPGAQAMVEAEDEAEARRREVRPEEEEAEARRRDLEEAEARRREVDLADPPQSQAAATLVEAVQRMDRDSQVLRGRLTRQRHLEQEELNALKAQLRRARAEEQDMERQENGAQRQLADTSHQLQEAEESWAQREPVLEMELGEARKSILARQVLLDFEEARRQRESSALREELAAAGAALEQARAASNDAKTESRRLLDRAHQDLNERQRRLIESQEQHIESQRQQAETLERMRHEMARCQDEEVAECRAVAESRRREGEAIEARIRSENRLLQETAEKNQHQGRAVLEQEAVQWERRQRQIAQEDLAAATRQFQVQQQEADANLMAEMGMAQAARRAATNNQQQLEQCETARQAIRAEWEAAIREGAQEVEGFQERLRLEAREAQQMEQELEARSAAIRSETQEARSARQRLLRYRESQERARSALEQEMRDLQERLEANTREADDLRARDAEREAKAANERRNAEQVAADLRRNRALLDQATRRIEELQGSMTDIEVAAQGVHARAFAV